MKHNKKEGRKRSSDFDMKKSITTGLGGLCLFYNEKKSRKYTTITDITQLHITKNTQRGLLCVVY